MITAPRASTGRRRDRYIDSLRALALGRVVAYHWFGWAWLPFVFPSMGIMFALAGSLVASSLDRADHNPWAVLRKRTFRLLPPLWVLGLVLVPLMLLHDGWIATAGEGGTPLSLEGLFFWVLPINDPVSSDWGYAEGLTVPLWYIRAYFWFLLLSPAFLWMFRRWPKRILALPLVTVTLAGFGILPVSLDGDSSSRIVATMSVFGACWLLGFAHHDDKIRALPLAFVLPTSVVLIGLGAYWTATTNGWQIDDSELGEALYCLGFVLLLLRFYPSFEWLRRFPWLDKLITVFNSRAMTIYLWGNVAILLAAWVMSSSLVPDVLVGSEWRYQVVGFLVVWLLIGVAVVGVGWVEDVAGGRAARLNPWPRTVARHGHPPLHAPSVTAVPRRPTAPVAVPVPVSAPASAAPAVGWRQLAGAGASGAVGMLAVAAAVAVFWIASDDASVAPGGGDSAVTVLREAPPAPQPVPVPNIDDASEGAVDNDVPVVYRVDTQLVEQPITADILDVPILQPEVLPSGAVAPPLPTTVPVPTAPPATGPPITGPPTTAPPTTAPPTTAPPTTAPPTTAPPTTAPPTTAPPTTAPPTTAPPTTAPPTTAPPTTAPPTTAPPTTPSPITQPPPPPPPPPEPVPEPPPPPPPPEPVPEPPPPPPPPEPVPEPPPPPPPPPAPEPSPPLSPPPPPPEPVPEPPPPSASAAPPRAEHATVSAAAAPRAEHADRLAAAAPRAEHATVSAAAAPRAEHAIVSTRRARAAADAHPRPDPRVHARTHR